MPDSSSYAATTGEANQELKSGVPVRLAGEMPDLSSCDTFFLVCPIWWGTLPMPVKIFLRSVDLKNTTVYLLITNGGSELGNTVSAAKELTDATVSELTLAVYDDDAAAASEQVAQWLRQIAERDMR